jgi:hypothetical protein
MRQVTILSLPCVRIFLIRLKLEVKAVSAGQWSARKAQMLAKQYKAKGGGYK